MTQIINRCTKAVITEGEMPLRELVLHYVETERALNHILNLRYADLSDADLRDADLSGANLSYAYLIGANLRGANLRDADLSYAYLIGANLIDANLSYAYLRGSYLRGADLSGAHLKDADLSYAYLSDTDLSYVNLSGANLIGANLRGAYLIDAFYRGITIQSCAVFTGIYKYIVIPIIAEDGTEYIRLGCYFRTVEEWKTDFWNNPSEFPNNGDIPSKLRWMAYQTCLQWFEINRAGGSND